MRWPAPLETPRLVLRPAIGADVPALARLFAEPEVYRFLFDGVPPSVEEVHEIVAASEESFRRHRVGLFLALDRDDGAMLGVAGLRPAEIDGLELVCALSARVRGRGLAEEACRACLRHAFDEAGVAEVLAGADAPNASSHRLIARLGFEPRGETPGAFGAIRWYARRLGGAS